MLELGVVVIGRNEGDRLLRCVQSLASDRIAAVYVDSGSTDDSVELARKHGFEVVELDTSLPFSAARARNEGLFYLLKKFPTLQYMQFVDGDCEVNDSWLSYARSALESNQNTAVVCGRRRERYPSGSIFNMLCDIEWNTPVGRARSSGGDFMARVDALKSVEGFNPDVVAGEEPELCYRLRREGWVIERLDHEMTLHDAMIGTLSQWWKRVLRSGHAYAHNMVLHWGEDERLNQRTVLSILVWGGFIPVVALVSLFVAPTLSALIVLIYTIMVFRIYSNVKHQRALPGREALAYAFFTMLGKVPQAIGVFKCLYTLFSRKSFQIIEYKK